jgi:hydroxymethylbilane synthase
MRIGSRGRKLALAQASIVKKSLEKLSPGLEFSIVKVSTRGDRHESDFLHKSEFVGLSTSGVENAILDTRPDIDGKNLIRRCGSSTIDESGGCAPKPATELLEAGSREILERIRSN